MSKVGVLLALLATSSCTLIGPSALKASRLRYNETVKATAEEEMLLNVVRLRYSDTPSSLAVSSIAAQFELAANAGGTPFYTANADPSGRAPFPLVLPQAAIAGADRPTFSLTPLDDSDFARRLFTPLSLEGAIYLARTTWPISTVFRLYLENLNWVSNAQTASGPTPALAPEPSAFLEGIRALQALQHRGEIVFGHEERVEFVGGPIPQSSVSAQASVAAAEQGLELASSNEGVWHLQRKQRVPVLYVSPRALDSADAKTFFRAFSLAPGSSFDVTVEGLKPFDSSPAGFRSLDLETRSLLQALYFVSHGVDVPPEHLESGQARQTKTADGKPFDWAPQLAGLFHVRSERGGCSGDAAAVAVEYRGACFFIERNDHDTRATFALLIELARLEVPSNRQNAPILTLPLGQ